MNFLKIFLTIFLLLLPCLSKAALISEEENSLQITSLMSAVIDEDIASVEFFSKSDNEKINQKNIGGATALALACRKGNFEIVKILLDNGALVNNVDNEGWTPLMRAANLANYEIVELLLKAGGDATKLNSQKEGALVYSAKSGCAKCFAAIFNKFDLSHILTVEQLESQLNQAFIIAKKQNNLELQNVINEKASLIAKMKAEEEKQYQSFKIIDNDFEAEKPREEKFKNSADKKYVAPFLLNSASKKKFIFQKSKGSEIKAEIQALQNSENPIIKESKKSFKFNKKEDQTPSKQELEKLSEDRNNKDFSKKFTLKSEKESKEQVAKSTKIESQIDNAKEKSLPQINNETNLEKKKSPSSNFLKYNSKDLSDVIFSNSEN